MTPAEHCSPSATHWRCSWVDRPGARIATNDGLIDQSANELYLIPPGLSYGQYFTCPLVQIYLSLLLPDLPEDPGLLRHPVTTTTADLLRQLASALMTGHTPDPSQGAAATALVGLILTSQPPDIWRRPVPDRRIAAAVEAIRRDPMGAPDNPGLASKAGLSQGYFLRRFRALTGTTPQALRLQHRLEAAALALRRGEPIKAVAHHHGWQSRQRFTAAFRRHFGTTPSAWVRSLMR